MSKSYLVPHDFSQITVSMSNDTINFSNSSFTAGSNVSGEYIMLNSTSGSSVVVPSLGVGFDMTFIVSATSPNHSVTVPPNTLFGIISQGTSGNLAANSNHIINSTTGSCVGDRFKLVCDGTNFYVEGNSAKFNGFTFA